MSLTKEDIRKLIFEHLTERKEGLSERLTAIVIDDIDMELINSSDKIAMLNKAYKSLHGFLKSGEIGNWTVFLSSYNTNYSSDFETDKTKKKYTDRELTLIDLGKMLANYHKHLDSIKRELTGTSTKAHQFTITQQLLILDYLGVISSIKKNNSDDSVAIFLSGLINKNSQDIRGLLGKLLSIKSPSTKEEKRKLKRTLSELKTLFDNLNITSVSKKLKRDIDSLEK